MEVAVFVDTNLGTRIAMDVSPDITATDFKRELETRHFSCFWKLGEIRVSGLMVNRKSCLYHLPDSMRMKSAFQGVKGTWFLHVEARLLLSDCNRPCLHRYAASKVGNRLNSESFVTSSAAISNAKGNYKRSSKKLFRRHKPLVGKLRRPFYFTKKRKRRKNIYQVNGVPTDRTTFPDSAHVNEVGVGPSEESVTDEPTHSSSEVVSVSGIIRRYFSNLIEDGAPASHTRSVPSRVVKSWPEEHLKTKAADFGQTRYELNKPEVGKRLLVASYGLGVSPSKEHPAGYLCSLKGKKISGLTSSSVASCVFKMP